MMINDPALMADLRKQSKGDNMTTTTDITIEFPTDRPNFTIVSVGSYSVAFSYRTPIGFNRWDGNGWITRENVWGPTTGKHINHLDGGGTDAKQSRVDSDTFDALLREVTA